MNTGNSVSINSTIRNSSNNSGHAAHGSRNTLDQGRTAGRLAALAIATALTLAMLAGVNGLARNDGAAPQLAQGAAHSKA